MNNSVVKHLPFFCALRRFSSTSVFLWHVFLSSNCSVIVIVISCDMPFTLLHSKELKSIGLQPYKEWTSWSTIILDLILRFSETYPNRSFAFLIIIASMLPLSNPSAFWKSNRLFKLNIDMQPEWYVFFGSKAPISLGDMSGSLR
jgi:hypothetical protein